MLKTSLQVNFVRCLPLSPATICAKMEGRWWCLEQDAEETVWTKEAGSCREWRKLYNEKRYDLYCSQNIVGLMD